MYDTQMVALALFTIIFKFAAFCIIVAAVYYTVKHIVVARTEGLSPRQKAVLMGIDEAEPEAEEEKEQPVSRQPE